MSFDPRRLWGKLGLGINSWLPGWLALLPASCRPAARLCPSWVPPDTLNGPCQSQPQHSANCCGHGPRLMATCQSQPQHAANCCGQAGGCRWGWWIEGSLTCSTLWEVGRCCKW